jgi:hypothetical protein
MLSNLLLVIAKRILLISINILTSQITWVIGGLTLIGAIIGDLVSFCLTGEAKISKGLLEFTEKHFPGLVPWMKKIHNFMTEAGQGCKDVLEAGQILFDAAMDWIKQFFDRFDERFKIVDKMKTILDGWNYTFGGGKE